MLVLVPCVLLISLCFPSRDTLFTRQVIWTVPEWHVARAKETFCFGSKLLPFKPLAQIKHWLKGRGSETLHGD